MGHLKRSWLLAVAIPIAACSPYRFSAGIDKFATGVTDVQQAVTTSSGSARTESAVRERIEFDNRMPSATAADCASDPPDKPVPAASNQADAAHPPAPRGRCRIVIARTLTPAETTKLVRRETLLAQLSREEREAGIVLDQLTAYVEALQALANAKDRVELDTARDHLVASMTALSMPADVVAPGTSTLVGAVTHGVLWLVGQGLDAERRATLDWAVNAMAPHLATVSRKLLTALSNMQTLRLTIGVQTLDAITVGLGHSLRAEVYATSFALAQSVAERQDALQRVRADSVVDKMLATHTKLKEALATNDSADLVDFIKAAGDFAAEASAVCTALAARRNS